MNISNSNNIKMTFNPNIHGLLAFVLSVALKDERDSFNGKITELQSLVYAKDLELKDFDVTMSSLKSQNNDLVDQVHALEATFLGLRDQVSNYELLKEQIEAFLSQMKILNDKVAKLDADHLEMALHLEEKFYPHLLTTISGWKWLLTLGLKLVVVKCLNLSDYLTALGAAISRAIEKGMQSGLVAGIAYNPVLEADYNFVLLRLREVDFLFLVELRSHKDASVADIMNLLRLEGPLADAPGMSDLQPNVEQLMLLIHRSEDQVVLGKTSLSLSLSVAHSRVEKIRKNIVAVSTTVLTTTALSPTFASTSLIPPITIDDNEIVGADDHESVQGNVQENFASFPTVEFENEELDTTP
nr:hypothetical protein [Tanacetum cinerariifolium]